jgi:REP element-mobilizing transposase RayT
MYFVTICTKNMKNYFGEINGSMQIKTLQATKMGEIACSEWYRTLELRPDMNLELGEFVVMPNHIHGIIMIGANEYNTPRNISCGDAMHRVSTNQFVPQSKNLSSIIRGYKSAVTVFARKNKIDFAWHPRFHDRIIRSTFEYNNISNYIINNPAKWVEDKFYQKINPLRR